MKKVLIFALTSICLYPMITFALPAECADRPELSQCTSTSSATVPKSSPTETTIPTSEKVPGANCVQKDSGSGGVAGRKYECTIPNGLAGFQSIFAQIIRWVINIVLLLGVLAVVGLGIAWSFAGGDDMKAKTTLKQWAINIIIGLIILFFFTYILTFLAPWVYQ